MIKTKCEDCLNADFCKYVAKLDGTDYNYSEIEEQNYSLPMNYDIVCRYFRGKSFVSHMLTSLGDVSSTPPTYLGHSLNWSAQSSSATNVKP